MFKKIAACVVVAVAFAALPAQAQPAKPAPAAAAPAVEDKYVGYYYPKPTTVENYTSPMQTIQGAERAQRVQFVTVVSQGTIQSAYRVPYSVFVKGDKAEKMIIVGLQPGELACILAESIPEWLFADMGVLGSGAVSVGIYPTSLITLK